MNVSEVGKRLIKEFEGLSLKPYLCPANKLTVGYGHLIVLTDSDLFGLTERELKRLVVESERRGKVIPKALRRLSITEGQASYLLNNDLAYFVGVVKRLVTVRLQQHHLDALTSFVFNVGEGNFRRSTLLKRLNEGDYHGASQQFIRWVFATVNGDRQKLAGLVRRRNAERDLFNLTSSI